jgi:hypothetical protein
MFGSARRRLVCVSVSVAALVLPIVGSAQPAQAFPKGDFVFNFAYKVKATTVIKKLNQTITTPQGTFKGGIDIDKGGVLLGHIKLPPTSFTVNEAGLPLATATAQIVEAKPVTGKVNLSKFFVTATSTFNLKILSIVPVTPSLTSVGGLPLPVPPLPLPPVPPVNLVGNACTTATPIVVTMSGIADPSKPSTFKGTFTIPKFKTCGALTAVLNQVIPGPGNTFIATARP